MDNELLRGGLAMPAHARRPTTSPTLKHLHEGRVYLRNNQDRRALFPRRCVSRSSTPSSNLIVNPIMPDFVSGFLYGSLDSRSAIRRVVPDFGTSDSSKGEGHFNEKKKKLNQVRREESSFEFSIDESIYFVLGIVHR